MHANYMKRLLATILVLALVVVAWQERFVLLLVFGSILFAVIIHIAAREIEKRTGLSTKIAAPFVVLLLFAMPILAGWRFGSEIAGQIETITQALPSGLDEVRALLADAGLNQVAEQGLNDFASGSQLFSTATGALMSLADGLLNIVVVLAGGLFLAGNPDLYREGALKLLPASTRDEAAKALDESGAALGLWLKGRLFAMVAVSIITAFGLWLIGIPSYLALGLLAGAAEFVPFLGPILAAVPGVLLALLVGPYEALLTAALYLLVQQIEGNLLTPVIQQHAVDIPAALLLFSVLAFGYLFGLIGVILAAPLTVVLFVMVKRLYVRDHLDTPTPIPGSDD